MSQNKRETNEDVDPYLRASLLQVLEKAEQEKKNRLEKVAAEAREKKAQPQERFHPENLVKALVDESKNFDSLQKLCLTYMSILGVIRQDAERLNDRFMEILRLSKSIPVKKVETKP